MGVSAGMSWRERAATVDKEGDRLSRLAASARVDSRTNMVSVFGTGQIKPSRLS